MSESGHARQLALLLIVVPGTAWATGSAAAAISMLVLYTAGLLCLPAAMWSGVTAVTSTKPEMDVFLQRCGSVVLGFDLLVILLFVSTSDEIFRPIMVLQAFLLLCLIPLYVVHRLVLYRGRKALERGNF